MSRNNPYESTIEDYTDGYDGPYDPVDIGKQQDKKTSKGQSPKSQNPKRTLEPQIQVQNKGIVSKTIENVKNTAEDVVESVSSKQSLTDVADKKTLSVLDYAILLSSVYGIGAAVGITAGAAKNITPNRAEKPKLFWIMVSLGAFGAYKGFKTATQYSNLQSKLEEESKLEKKLSQYVSKDKFYR